MNTQTIVEGILYASGDNPVVRECFELCHIIDNERNWQSVPHVHLYYLDAFKKPYFLYIIDKQIHVYIIGDKSKGMSYNVINIEGMMSQHYCINKSKLRQLIYNSANDVKQLYLPESNYQRIIFIKPDYDTNTLNDNHIYVFNKFSHSAKSTIFHNSSTWTIGHNVYDVNQREYSTNAYKILAAIFAEF